MTFLVHSMTQKNLSRKESPAMSIPFKTMMGTAYIALAINFSETGKKNCRRRRLQIDQKHCEDGETSIRRVQPDQPEQPLI